MSTINVYLIFDGNCEEAFEYYKSVFGGEFSSISRFAEMPSDPNYPIPEEDQQKIMHVSLPISRETVLMGSDRSGLSPELLTGNNFSLSVNPDSMEEADRIFDALSKDGVITMPMEKAFWGSYFGMCKDKFAVQWMVNYQLEQ